MPVIDYRNVDIEIDSKVILEDVTFSLDEGGGVGCAIALPVAKALHAQGAEVTLREAGVQMAMEQIDMSEYTDKLAGKSIVISGVFAHHSRDEYKEMIEKNGGKNVGSISKKTSFILAGENMGEANTSLQLTYNFAA